MLSKVVQHLLKIANTMSRARDVWMDTKRHHTDGALAFRIEARESIFGTLQESIELVLSAHHDCDVVYLNRIRDRDQRAVLRFHPHWLVIQYPVAEGEMWKNPETEMRVAWLSPPNRELTTGSEIDALWRYKWQSTNPATTPVRAR